jgi:hypothetical protein
VDLLEVRGLAEDQIVILHDKNFGYRAAAQGARCLHFRRPLSFGRYRGPANKGAGPIQIGPAPNGMNLVAFP